MKKILIIYYNYGGGHRIPAFALADFLSKNFPTQYDPVLFCPTKSETKLEFPFLVDGEDIYRFGQKLEWNWVLTLLDKIGQVTRHFTYKKNVKFLSEFLKKENPDMLVSFIPEYNLEFYRANRQLRRVPHITVLTDYYDYRRNNFFIDQPQYYACSSPKAVKQAAELASKNLGIFQLSGLIVRPEICVKKLNRDDVLESIGFQSNKPIGLMMWGAAGSKKLIDIANVLNTEAMKDHQFIFLTGENTNVKQRINSLQTTYRKIALGFVKNVSDYMQIADFAMIKSGGSAVAECLAMKLPIILEKSRKTVAWEMPNIDFVEEHGLGIVIRNYKDVVQAIQTLYKNKENYEKRMKNHPDNTAVNDIVDIIDKLVEE